LLRSSSPIDGPSHSLNKRSFDQSSSSKCREDGRKLFSSFNPICFSIFVVVIAHRHRVSGEVTRSVATSHATRRVSASSARHSVPLIANSGRERAPTAGIKRGRIIIRNSPAGSGGSITRSSRVIIARLGICGWRLANVLRALLASVIVQDYGHRNKELGINIAGIFGETTRRAPAAVSDGLLLSVALIAHFSSSSRSFRETRRL
jgi:hypothetical protein